MHWSYVDLTYDQCNPYRLDIENSRFVCFFFFKEKENVHWSHIGCDQRIHFSRYFSTKAREFIYLSNFFFSSKRKCTLITCWFNMWSMYLYFSILLDLSSFYLKKKRKRKYTLITHWFNCDQYINFSRCFLSKA